MSVLCVEKNCVTLNRHKDFCVTKKKKEVPQMEFYAEEELHSGDMCFIVDNKVYRAEDYNIAIRCDGKLFRVSKDIKKELVPNDIFSIITN